MMTCLCDIGW